ncbi:dTDP-4-dehydrorhamnose reductase [soil metagenome]
MPGATPVGERPVLLIGAKGQIGRHLFALLSATRPVVAISRADLDLRDESRIRETVRRYAPSIVINTAAYTQVDDAEKDEATCWAVNARAPEILAAEAAAVGALTIDFSTNYVFAGEGVAGYRESDTVRPLSVYGRSKAEGERRIAAANPRHIVIRTHGIYDARGSNFLRRILTLARERDELRVVDDQVGAPTPAVLIAEAVVQLVNNASARGWHDDNYGILHVATSGDASWYDFACRALALDPLRAQQRCTVLRPIPSAEFVTPAQRPLNGRLDTSRARMQFGISLPAWDEALEVVMKHWGTE